MPVGLCVLKIHHRRAKITFEINYISFFFFFFLSSIKSSSNQLFWSRCITSPQANHLHGQKAPETHSSQYRRSLCPFWSWPWAAPPRECPWNVDGQGQCCWASSDPLRSGPAAGAGCCSLTCSANFLPRQAWTTLIVLINKGQAGCELGWSWLQPWDSSPRPQPTLLRSSW